MSSTEGIDHDADQPNGGALKEPSNDPLNPVNSTNSTASHDKSNDSVIDTSQTSHMDTSLNDQEIKINNKTNEEESTLNQSGGGICGRELKLLLASSKEAKLDTNLTRKRKIVSLRKQKKKYPPVTAESELEMELVDKESHEDDSGGSKTVKRKKSVASEVGSIDGAVDESIARKRGKILSVDVPIFKPNKDMFCWRCHKDSVNIACETCPRCYHQKCLKQTITDPEHWPCPECVSILKAESTQSRSPAMRGMTLENLCNLLKFAVKRMKQCQGSEPFVHAVNEIEFPDYKKYIIQPMDLTLLGKNIKENLYGSPQAFEADAKWILHNSIIFNSYQSKLTNVAKTIMKICKQEMAEIENCPSCYLNANSKKDTWFVEVCPKPHLLVWAKLRGFPFWPGKAMSCKDGMVDVRFFGAHDRAWVPEKECFLYSPKDPNLFRVKRADIEQCVEELEVHVENLKKVFGEFHYPTFKTPIDPENELKQLQIFLPRYKAHLSKNKTPKKLDKSDMKMALEDEGISASEKNDKEDEQNAENNKNDYGKLEGASSEDDSMEGYGTDDESIPEIDTEFRKTLLKKSKPIDKALEADEYDTQMPSNIEPDTSDTEELVLTRELIRKHADEKKSKSNSEPSSKRPSLDGKSPIERRNSEAKSDTSSTKINKVGVISEDMEISLGNTSKDISDFSVELKKKPVQVDVDNVEFTISPASKLKMADKLMKRLSDEGVSVSKVEEVKRKVIDEESKNEKTQELEDNNETSSLDSTESFNIDKAEENASEKVDETEKQQKSDEPIAISPSKCIQIDKTLTREREEDEEIINNTEESGKVQTESSSKQIVQEKDIEKDTLEKPVESTGEKSPKSVETVENDEPMDIATENVDLNIDKSKIINIIHSSLSDSSPGALTTKSKPQEEPKRNNKRKKSLDLEAIEIQNKIVKLATTSNNEPEILTSDTPILKSTLQQEKNVSLNAESEEIPIEEIKSEPEDEVEDIQDMEAKKKYLSALNILEKGEVSTVQKPKTNEIRTRSKTEEKREKSRIADNMSKVIEDVVVNYSANKTPTTVLATPRTDSGEIYVKSFAKIVPNTPETSSTTTLPPTKQRARKSFPQPNYGRPLIKPNPQPVLSRITPTISTMASKTSISKKTTSDVSSVPVTTLTSTVANVQQTSIATSVSSLQSIEAVRAPNGYFILQPTQQDNVLFLPPNQTINYTTTLANQVVSVTPCLVSAPANATLPSSARHLQPQQWFPPAQSENQVSLNVSDSQNYIPQGELAKTVAVNCNNNNNSNNNSNGVQKSTVATASSTENRNVVNGHPESAPMVTLSINLSPDTCNSGNSSTLSTATTCVDRPLEAPIVAISAASEVAEPALTNENGGDDDDLTLLNSIVPENITRAVSEVIRRPPPKLKPRPPGPLSQHFCEGTPSAAGPLTNKINSIAHRLGDYFRGMLIETLEDLGKTNNPEATIVNLKLEIEQLKYKHNIELMEIEKNMSMVMKDIQKSIATDREKVVEETRATCEAEAVKRVEEAKSKQWCANCSKEAQFYCCWNTSYCDYPCQQKHWPAHMTKCTQNSNQASTSGMTATATLRPGPGANQQIILRPANPPPKGSNVGRVITTKPLQKVYMNRSVASGAPKTMRVQTSSGGLLTMMETSPGNYQLVTTSTPLVRTAVTNSKPANIISISAPSGVKNTTQQQKNSGPSKSATKRLLAPHPMPVTAVLEEESD